MNDAIPEITWRELIVDHWGWSEQDGIAHPQDDYGISKKEARAALGDIAPEDSIGGWFFLHSLQTHGRSSTSFALTWVQISAVTWMLLARSGLETVTVHEMTPGRSRYQKTFRSLPQARLIGLGEEIKIEVATW